MKSSRVLQYMGVMLFLGCTVALVFTLVFWFLLSFKFSEGILATAFFASLATVGFATFKVDYREKDVVEEIMQ